MASSRPEDGGKDVFVQSRRWERAGMTGLADDQVVEFELIEDTTAADGRQPAPGLIARRASTRGRPVKTLTNHANSPNVRIWRQPFSEPSAVAGRVSSQYPPWPEDTEVRWA